jgi:regulator of replication initiation timing
MEIMEKQLNSIHTKLQQLLKQYLLLQKENDKLKAALDALNSSKEQDLEQIQQLQLQVSILKSSVGQMPVEDKKAFDKQITQYIKEIDKCISLLSA